MLAVEYLRQAPDVEPGARDAAAPRLFVAAALLHLPLQPGDVRLVARHYPYKLSSTKESKMFHGKLVNSSFWLVQQRFVPS